MKAIGNSRSSALLALFDKDLVIIFITSGILNTVPPMLGG
jgi:uncharacterized membrane protein YukC